MFLNAIFQLTLILDSEKFTKLFDRAYSTLEYVGEDMYADYTLASKGITVLYQDSQYKKKIKLIVNPCRLLDNDKLDPDKLSRKLDNKLNSHFGSKYKLDNFELSGMGLTTDIDVRSREKVSAYLKVLHRIGRVKGFSPSRDNSLDDDIGLFLDGNSNGIKFLLYDLAAILGEQANEGCYNRSQKYIPKDCKGLLRAEVRLVKPKALRVYTNRASISKQIIDLYDSRQQIFLDTFLRIVPFGNFYKKNKAEQIICEKVKDATIRRMMLHVVGLVPKKKSLLLAQKALNYRGIDKVMEAFFNIEVAPITISKRHDIKKLDNLYNYL